MLKYSPSVKFVRESPPTDSERSTYRLEESSKLLMGPLSDEAYGTLGHQEYYFSLYPDVGADFCQKDFCDSTCFNNFPSLTASEDSLILRHCVPYQVTTANVLCVPNGQRFGSDFYYYFQT